jgi:hypothetical protein
MSCAKSLEVDMSNTKTGGHAFPTSQIADSDGMPLRDYFAAKALQGLCAGFPVNDIEWPDSSCPEHYDVAASHAYMMADAMLKARDA